MPGRAGDAAAGMRAGAADDKALQRAAVIGVAEHRPRREKIWSSDIAPWKISPPMSPKSRSRSSGVSALRAITLALKPGCVAVDGRDHRGRRPRRDDRPMICPPAVPARRAGRTGSRHAAPFGASVSSSVEGDQHLDDRLAAPADAGAHRHRRGPCRQGSRAMMMPAVCWSPASWPGRRGEARQFRQRDVHPEGAGAAFPSLHAGEGMMAAAHCRGPGAS